MKIKLEFPGLLLLLFITLKLTGVIAWSWWWVLSPLWISAAFVTGFIGGWLVLVAQRRGRIGFTRR